MKTSSKLKKSLGIVVVLLLINLLASQFFKRVDFTSDHKYTLSNSTVQLVESLEKLSRRNLSNEIESAIADTRAAAVVTKASNQHET